MTKEINLDIILIKLFINKLYYSKYYSYINKYLLNNYRVNNKLLYKLYKSLETLHTEHESVSFEDIYLRLQTDYPALPADELKLAQETLQRASEAVFNEDEVSTLLQRQYEAAKASEVALKAIQVTEGKAGLDELRQIVEANELEEQESESPFYENDLEGLYKTTKGTPGLRWPLMSLNKTLGSLRPGDFGFFFARPETGKTTFLAHVVTSMVKASGKGALWVNNEEGGNKVLLRCYQSMLGVSTKDLFRDVAGNQERYLSEGGQRIQLLNDPAIKHSGIERIVADRSPALVVIDQLDKVEGFEGERYDLKMKNAYNWARQLAIKYQCAVLAVCQAGGSAENKKRLVMTDVDSSWTAKQGEADFLFGIGKTDEEGMDNIRFINICKNKLVGDEDSDESLRHLFFDVIIEPEIGRYKDRMKW